MRRACLCFSTMGIVLAATCACVTQAPMTPSASPVTTPASATAEAQPPPKDVDPCLGQMRFEGQGIGADPGAPTETSIRLLSITPQAGTPVGENTALQADLAYSVRDFQPGHFKIMAQFDTYTSMTTDGAFKNYPFPESPAGKLHFCFPLRFVWNLPDIKRPLVVRFLLNRVYESGMSQSVARTEKVTFASSAEASNVPRSAAATRSDEYDVALVKAYAMFEQYAADSRYCAEQFPELAPETNESFERWVQRYSRVKAEVNALFIKWVAARTGGDPRTAQQMVDDFRRVAALNSTKVAPEQLRNKCRLFSSFMASTYSDPEANLSSELRVIRQGANVVEPH
jgi:hypothetical protein